MASREGRQLVEVLHKRNMFNLLLSSFSAIGAGKSADGFDVSDPQGDARSGWERAY